MKYAAHESGKFHTWLFDQGEVWVDRYGNEHVIEEMNVGYLRNVVSFLQKGARPYALRWLDDLDNDQAYEQRHRIVLAVRRPLEFVESSPLMEALKAEIEQRAKLSSPRVAIRIDMEQVAGAFAVPASMLAPPIRFVPPYAPTDAEFVGRWLREVGTTEPAADANATGVADQLREFAADPGFRLAPDDLSDIDEHREDSFDIDDEYGPCYP